MHRILAGGQRAGNGFISDRAGGRRGEPARSPRVGEEAAPRRAIPPMQSESSSPRTKPRLFDQVREVMRFKHYSIRTEEAYLGWIRRNILFFGKRYPETLGTEEVRAVLTALAVKGKVAAPTQNQTLSALLFLYGQVLKKQIGRLADVERAQRPPKLPVVCAPEEVSAILRAVRGGPTRLMAHLLYGSGLRLMARKSFAHVPRSARDAVCSMSMCRDRSPIRVYILVIRLICGDGWRLTNMEKRRPLSSRPMELDLL
jgi:hypothetical protein